MICFIALPILAILGLFSASHRRLAAESFDCVFRKITFRKCHSRLDERIKSGIVGKLFKHSPKLASKVHKHFLLLSWIFILLMVLSAAGTAYGFYNYSKYGNCNGPESEAFCVFDPMGHNTVSGIGVQYDGPFVYPGIDDDPTLGNKDAKVEIIEFGCFRCPYTKEAESSVKRFIEEYGDRIHYVYRDFPLNAKHAEADIHAEAANCALEQGEYWEYHDLLFEHQDMAEHFKVLADLALELGLDMTQFNDCFENRKYKEEVMKDFEDGTKAKVHGTPTFFINGEKIVGQQNYKRFKRIIDKKLKEAEEVIR